MLQVLVTVNSDQDIPTLQGTTMFMPQELLVHYSLNKDAPPIQRTASHDLQSFFWVISTLR